MNMTMTQKILAAHAEKDAVRPGELVMARLDLVLGNDITAPVAIREFPKFGRANVFDRRKIALVPDHFTPNKDIKAAAQCAAMRAFAQEQGIANYFEVGHDCGIEHALLPEKGLVTAGDLVIGADSHTCTYGALGAFSTGVGSTDMAAGMSAGETWFRVPSAIKVVLNGAPRKWVSGKDVILHLIGMIGVDGARYQSLEFAGGGIANLSMDDRFTIANMAIEAGAKNGIFPVDEQTLAYLRGHNAKPPRIFEADPAAEYERTIEIDLDGLEPVVAFPHLPSNVRPVRHARRCRGDARTQGGGRRKGNSDPRHAAHLASGDGGGAAQDFRRGRVCRLAADMRAVPRRTHGHTRKGRALRSHDEPELRRAHGAHRVRGVSCLARSRGSIGSRRAHRRSNQQLTTND